MYYGLGSYEDQVLDSLPRGMRALITAELDDPYSRVAISQMLRSPRPEMAIANEIRKEVRLALAEEGGNHFPRAGVGEMGGIFKKIGKAIKKTVKKVVAVKKKIIKKIGRPIVRPAKKVLIKYGSTIIPLVGGILAPFTGGASLAAAAAVAGGLTVYKAKKAADEAERLGKADAAQMAAAVAAQEAELRAQTDAIYQESSAVFQSIGITPEKWASLSTDARIGIIDALSKGQLPPGYSYVSEAEAAAEAAPPPAAAPKPPPVAYQPPPVTYKPPPATYQPPPVQYYPPAPQGSSASVEAPPPAAPEYQVYVEGMLVGSAGTKEEAVSTALSNSIPGDRIEISLNGQSTGLRVRTQSGVVTVPPDQADKVRSMSHEQMESAVSAPAAASSSGKSWMWLLALPAAFVLSKAA